MLESASFFYCKVESKRVSVPELVNGMDPRTSVAFQPYRYRQRTATLAAEQMHAGYSGWQLVRNYDTVATGFGGLFDGFMSLTSYFDVMYRY